MKNILLPGIVSVVVIIAAFLFFESLETTFNDLLMGLKEHPGEYAFSSFLILASDIVLPVPSSIVMYTNGLVLGGFLGTLISMFALMVSAGLGYYLGMFTSYGSQRNKTESGNLLMQKYGGLAILITRGIPILSESVCIVCGYNKMPVKQYLLYNLIGYIPVTILYAVFGSLGYDKHTFLISFLLSLVLSALFWVFGKKLISKLANLEKSTS